MILRPLIVSITYGFGLYVEQEYLIEEVARKDESERDRRGRRRGREDNSAFIIPHSSFEARCYNPQHMDWTRLPTIDADRVTLRWISSDDVDALYKIFSNREVMRYWSTPPLPDRDAAVELLDEIHDGFRKESLLKWGVARRSDDMLIGTTTLYNLDLGNRRVEMGYALGREYWGQGYMAESLQALLEYCFEVLDLRRIEADVDPRNAPSIQTLERLGFQREGFLRERWEVDGEIQDALFYGLLRREWKGLDGDRVG